MTDKHIGLIIVGLIMGGILSGLMFLAFLGFYGHLDRPENKAGSLIPQIIQEFKEANEASRLK